MYNNDVVFFAQTNFRNQMRRFGIKTDDRRRHMYFIGKTGMGKSTVLENMIIDDIRSGRGVAVVDPHGDLAEKIIEFIPDDRIEDVVYFNPADMEYPIAFNLVEQVEPHLRHLVASGLIGVFQKLWADSWGPRLEYILRNAILAILDFPGSTLMGVVRMLSDKDYRKRVVANISDPVVKAFWEKEFAGYADKFASEAVSPIQNKVGQFLSSSFIRNIVGQVKSSIDMRDVMDEGKILIMNLSKGRIGEDNSALLGAMMITKIQLAAMSRVDIPEKERKDFYLYIDEFQNFSTESFANILSEARKYRLNLIMAHQYIEQLSETVKPAVFGNVGTIVVFRVGAADAEELVKEFTPVFTEEDIVNLPKFEFYLKLMIDGIASDPFSARGLPPLSPEEKTNNVEKVIASSREKYASAKSVVEERIMRWHQDDYKIEEDVADKKSTSDTKTEEEKITYPGNCAFCGIAIQTPFKPDGVRPIYCKDCLSRAKSRIAREKNEAEAKKTIIETKKEIEIKEEIKENLAKPKPESKKTSELKDTTQINTPKKFKENNPKLKNDFLKKKQVKAKNRGLNDKYNNKNFSSAKTSNTKFKPNRLTKKQADSFFIPRSKAELEVEQKFLSLEELSQAKPQSFYNKKNTNTAPKATTYKAPSNQTISQNKNNKNSKREENIMEEGQTINLEN